MQSKEEKWYDILLATYYFLTMQYHSIAVPAPAPAPAPLQRQLNVDNIEMQPSPAYVSLDSKTQLYQNI